MNTEKSKKAYITDSDRDNILQLHKCGISTKQIESMLHISRSSINYILHAHRSCVQKDYDYLHTMMKNFKPTVAWAMRVTNTDPSVLDNLPKKVEPVEKVADPAVIPETITRNDFLAMCATVQAVRSLLTEIRDVLNEIK